MRFSADLWFAMQFAVIEGDGIYIGACSATSTRPRGFAVDVEPETGLIAVRAGAAF
jgi:hypothetical protein